MPRQKSPSKKRAPLKKADKKADKSAVKVKGTAKNGVLTHLNAQGEAHMVDVGEKAKTVRQAVAIGKITMQPETLTMIQEDRAKKGDVLAVARVAAIMAAKRTSEWIPLCHPIALTHINVVFEIGPPQPDARSNKACIACRVTVKCVGETGVEMEALSAVSAGLLTLYDMCKAVDRGMEITTIALQQKSGGRSGLWKRDNTVNSSL